MVRQLPREMNSTEKAWSGMEGVWRKLEASSDLSRASQDSWEGVSEEVTNWIDLCTKQSQIVMAEARLAN